MEKLTKVLFHCHTNYSNDGKLSCEEVANLGTSFGFDYVFLSDHYEHINQERFNELIEECNELNRKHTCVLVPGYEKSWNGYHVCAFNLSEWVDHEEYDAWCSLVRRTGGLVVAAHPTKYNFKIPQFLLDGCDGIEIWNSKWPYDGSFYPDPKALNLVGSLLHFCGQDVHKRRDFNNLAMLILGKKKVSESAVIESIKAGQYKVANRFVFSPQLSKRIYWMLAAYHFSRQVVLRSAYRLKKRISGYAKDIDK